MSEAIYFDDLQLGQTWVSPARTVTETDVVNFANITGDTDPLHVDHAHAASTHFRQPIAHGLLGLSWVAGLAINHPAIRTTAFTAVRDWNFLEPIFFGDTVHVQTTVAEMSSGGKRNGRVVWEKRLLNQDGRVVQSGVFETLVARRQPVPSHHLNLEPTGPEFVADDQPMVPSVRNRGRSGS